MIMKDTVLSPSVKNDIFFNQAIYNIIKMFEHMIEQMWKKMSADPAAEGYTFRKIGLPCVNADSMFLCRGRCAENLCGEYGMTWGCPPGVGSGEECLNIVKSFSEAAIIIKKFDGVDLTDTAFLAKVCAEHQDVCRRFGLMLRKEGYDALPLSDGGCKYCKECSYPDGPCRFPEQRVTSISCYGIMMDEYMKSQNIDFEFRKDAVALYGLLFYNEPRKETI